MDKLDIPIQYKAIIATCIILFFLVVYFAGGSSRALRMYLPQGDVTPTEEEEELLDIEYNNQFLEELSGGYAGAPKLVASDDKVFYIPPEYCDGSYLRNFRVIGVNRSQAEEKTVKKGDKEVTEYNGAVVVYGFQTTYKEDYGSNYNFSRDPYEYTMDYDTSNSYFEKMMQDMLDKAEGIQSDVLTTEETTEVTTDIDFDMNSARIKKNPDAVDDTDFRVATVVIEHEIGKDYCNILYCDADSCTVKDLGIGSFNLITDMNDTALTVCYNNNMYVYNFDDNTRSYSGKDRYVYSLDEFFDSSTFKNTMQGAGYVKSTYDVIMDFEYSNCSDGWVDTYLSKMNKHVELSITGDKAQTLYTYMSNLKGDTISKKDITEHFADTRQYVYDAVRAAYSGYKKTKSGWLSINNYSNVDDAKFGDFRFTSQSSNTVWALENDFTYDISERSLLVFYPKTYKGTAKGKVKLSIVPHFELLTQYDYTINDLILTQVETKTMDDMVDRLFYGITGIPKRITVNQYRNKGYSFEQIRDMGIITPDEYDALKSMRKLDYSIIMQMMVTPKEANKDTPPEGMSEEEVKKYAKMYPSNLAKRYSEGSKTITLNDFIKGDEDTPVEDDIDEDEIEEEDIDEKELEEEFNSQVKGVITEYLTFNIDLSNESGHLIKTDKIYSVEGASKAKEQFDAAKSKYGREFAENLKRCSSEVKTGPYLIADNNNAEGLERLKTAFAEIRDKCLQIEDVNNKITEAKNEIADMQSMYDDNTQRINDAAERLLGSENINKDEKNASGYYKAVESMLDPSSERYSLNMEDIESDINAFLTAHDALIKSFEKEADQANKITLSWGLPTKGGMGLANYGSPAFRYLRGLGPLSRSDLEALKRACDKQTFKYRTEHDLPAPYGVNSYSDYDKKEYNVDYDEKSYLNVAAYCAAVRSLIATDEGVVYESNGENSYSYNTYIIQPYIIGSNKIEELKRDITQAVRDISEFDVGSLGNEGSSEEQKEAYDSLLEAANKVMVYYGEMRAVFLYDRDRYNFYTEYLKPFESVGYADQGADKSFDELTKAYDEMFMSEPEYDSDVVFNGRMLICTYDHTLYPNDITARMMRYVNGIYDTMTTSRTGEVTVKVVGDEAEEKTMSFFDSLMSNTDIKIKQYEKEQEINELNEELEKLNGELTALEKKFDNTYFYSDLTWKGKRLNGKGLADSFRDFDAIVAEIDRYKQAFGLLDGVKQYRGDADKFIGCANEINIAVKDSGVYDFIEHSYNEQEFVSRYGTDAAEGYKYLASKGYNLFGDTSIASFLTDPDTDEEVTEQEAIPEDSNTALIKQAIENAYGGKGKNAIVKRSYDQYTEDCKELYKRLYGSFTKVAVTDENGMETEVCDITEDDIKNALFEYLIDKFGVYELYNYNEKGEVSATYSIAKAEQSGGNMAESIEQTSEATTEQTTYANSFEAIVSDYDAISSYTSNASKCYKDMMCIAVAFLRNTGCLTEEQQQIFSPESSGAEGDISSLYYRGYQVPDSKLDEMLTLLDNINLLYTEREKAADVIRQAEKNGLVLNVRNDQYCEDLYKNKCSQADKLYQLVYNAAKASGATEKQKYIDEFENTEWLILDDIDITDDLSSVIEVKTKTIVTDYKNIIWNTALITDDKNSNISPEPYDLYRTDSNFCIGVAENNGFIIPIGAQKDLEVRSLNAKIKSELRRMGGNLENVVYGSQGNVDYLIFSNDKKWISFAITTNGRTVDVNKITSYSGNFDCDTGDVHFMEFDKTRLTGVNQFYATSLDKGYIPYDITLKNNGNSTISEAKDPFGWESDPQKLSSGSKGIRGAYFNSWSDEKGNVVLLGFNEDDMRVETSTEAFTEATTEYVSPDAASEGEGAADARREISDMDIYDAHLYVYKFATKPADVPEDYDDPLSNWNIPAVDLFDAGIELDGPYGKLLQPAVNLFTVLRASILLIAYALASLYAVYLGTRYARADNEEKKENVKQHIKWFILSILLVHVLIAFLYLAQRQMTDWEESVTQEVTESLNNVGDKNVGK